jgi:hypothetical protein
VYFKSHCMNSKFFLIVIILSAACSNKPTEISSAEERKAKDTTTAAQPLPAVTPPEDTALHHEEMFKYFPPKIQGYKATGYPDENDYLSGEPTGETASKFTSGGPVSFAKQLYVNGEQSLAIEIIDYNPAKNYLEGLYKMYDFSSDVDNNLKKSVVKDLGIERVKSQLVYLKETNSAEMHIFICNRFLINISTVNIKSYEVAVMKGVNGFKIKELIKGHCK